MRLPILLICCAGAAGPAGAELVFQDAFDYPATAARSLHGAATLDSAGPRPPRYPGFAAENKGAAFARGGDFFSYPNADSLQFSRGDTITLEAWVRLSEIGKDQNVYLISKGRTLRPGFAATNQNYGLRLREVKGAARPSFLFWAAGDHHRWTANDGIAPGPKWHHVAVSYQFGAPESIRGWLDGRETRGAWDMGGATVECPVPDADELWLGAALGGKAENTLRGALDDVRIHRGNVPPEDLAQRFRYDAPQLPPAVFGNGVIAVQLFENIGRHDAWPEELPDKAALEWQTTQMAFPRLPFKYDDWGIRDVWKDTCFLRAGAETDLPAGKRRIVLRTRGGGRLSIDGREVLRTAFRKGSTDGHDSVPDLPKELAPGVRLAGYMDQEAVGEFEFTGRHRILLETIVGGPKYRPEPGETLVAVADAAGNMFSILGAGKDAPLSLTDANWPQIVARSLGADAKRHRSLAASQDAYWQKRHEHARTWAAGHPAPPVPAVNSTRWPAGNAIDAFLAAKFEKAAAAGAAEAPPLDPLTKSAHGILQRQCFRCHGDKEKGGLRLNERGLALKPGDSGSPAVVPGKSSESQLLSRIRLPKDDEERMPPQGDPLSAADAEVLERWIAAGAAYPAPHNAPRQITLPPLADDASFLRRVFLDTCGVVPVDVSAAEASVEKRAALIDKLLADDPPFPGLQGRWADHWVSYWQDVLAENPNILKPSLNNSGPFRYFLHDSLSRNAPMDRMVTELVMLRGSAYQGGSAGFGLAADNDAPLAQKAHVLASAFLGLEMKCARCHDSPYHSTKQEQLFALAAMLDRKAATVPKTSTVPPGFFEKNKGRKSLIKVTLPPGKPVEPKWPFASLCSEEAAAALCRDPRDSREMLAALITAPENSRFARILVNRVWKRLMGTGIVEPADDWEGKDASHPELLEWLAHELVTHGYDLKHLVRLILNSHAYQREAVANANPKEDPAQRFFAAPDRRRLTAEQLVDSLHLAAGREIDVEEITFDPEAMRDEKTMINLGKPARAWEFASLSNERDRPSLSLPKAQTVLAVMETFGWRTTRAEPLSCRDADPNVLQPATLANGVLPQWLCRLTDDCLLTGLAMDAESPASLTDHLFQRFLGRPPRPEERTAFESTLDPGFSSRIMPPDQAKPPTPLPPLRRVSWSNHLSPESNVIQQEAEARCRAGEPPTRRLDPAWRERMEDGVWTLINAPELLWVP